MAGIKAIVTKTGIILIDWAINPTNDITTATIPQENPFINPPIILLYFGKTFCAKLIVIGDANIVTKPVITKNINEITGIVLYVNPNNTIKGNGKIIEI